MSSLKSRKTVAVAMVLCVAILALVLVATGCGKASIVGKWLDPTDQTVSEFKADGTFVAPDMEGMTVTYKVEGDKITLTVPILGDISVGYELAGDTLKVQDPESGEWTTLSRVK